MSEKIVKTKTLNPARALRRFSFRQTIKSSLIIGLLVGLVMGAQGAAYAKAFPTQASRDKLVASLSSVSGINFFSGEVANAARPDSYAIYKSITLLTILTAVWGLMVTTRLLRGFEEDGRLELLESGAMNKVAVNARILIGYFSAFLLSFIIAFVLIALLGADPQVGLSLSGAALMTAAVYLPGLFFIGVGVLTSQLARTRSRALLYGLIPLIILYVLRGSANSVSSINWLKKFTPFGWSDLLNPVLQPSLGWILPTVLLSAAFMALGIGLASKRDLGEAILKQTEQAKSRFYLLGSGLKLAVRQHIRAFLLWGLGAIFYGGFFAAVANISTNLASDSPGYREFLAGGSPNELKLMFLGVGVMFVATILLIMITFNLAALRRDEAKGYLDNLLIQPLTRAKWLVNRLMLIAGMFVVIALSSGLVIWIVAHSEHIVLGLGTVLLGMLSLSGIMLVTLGIGAFFYGYAPRLAVAAMAVVIGWAFIFDITKSLFHISSWTIRTSLLSYIPINPSKTPDWVAFVWLVVIGLALMVIGVRGFTRRDIVAE